MMSRVRRRGVAGGRAVVTVLSTQYSVLGTCTSLVATLILAVLPAVAASQDESGSAASGTLLAPKAFRAAAASVQPSLVRIEGFGGIAAAGSGGGYQQPGVGATTGLIISPDGYILTSTFNFLRKPPVITAILPDGKRHIARLLGRDETRKICLLKVDDVSGLPTPPLAPRDELRVGQWAVAVGVGFGAAQPAISAGVISATSRISGKAVQTDANTSPANYGGPLIDLDGRVVGISVPLTPGIQKEAAGAEWYDSGIGFAIPLDGLERILDRLKQGETLQHAFLGVQVEPYGEPPTGAQIKKLVPDSPATKAGLAEKDRIIAVEGTEILDVTHLASVLHRYLAGDKIEIRIGRGDESKTVAAQLAAPPPEAKPAAGSEQPEKGKKPGEPKPGQPKRPQPERPPL
jgi:serine protease Do